MARAKCKACRGEGKRQVFDILFVRDQQSQLRTCPDCDGSGLGPAPEDVFEVEIDDTVAFAAESEYGIVQGEGKVVRTFKNGKIVVELGGKKYEATHFELMRKAV